MKYAIIRMQKLKSTIAVRRSLKHAFREQETPNADPSHLSQNSHFGAQSTSDALKKFNANMPEKIRKNGVLCCEFLITGSPEKMKQMTRHQQDWYFEDALAFLKEKHGEENVIYAGIHRDETTPHLYAYVTPRIGDKLNCAAFYGHKEALSELQGEFAARAEKHGLERGIQGSKAKRTRIKAFYADLNKTMQLPKLEHPANVPLPPSKFLEKKEDYARRAVENYKNTIKPGHAQLYRLAGLNNTHARTASEAKKTAEAAQKRALTAEKQRDDLAEFKKSVIEAPEQAVLDWKRKKQLDIETEKKRAETKKSSMQM